MFKQLAHAGMYFAFGLAVIGSLAAAEEYGNIFTEARASVATTR